VAGAQELPSLIADGAAGVGADGAVSDEGPVRLADDDVRLAVTGVGVGGGLPGRQLAGGAELDGSGGRPGPAPAAELPALVELPAVSLAVVLVRVPCVLADGVRAGGAEALRVRAGR